MSRDRITQIIALLVAVAAVFGAGRLLPTIVEKAGQEHLLVTVVDPETGLPAPGAEVEVERIYTSMIRSMETVLPSGSDRPIDIAFDAGTRDWSGEMEDVVEISWRDGASTRSMVGRLDEIDGYALRYTDSSIEGAPPIVALGTAIGALRGLIVDYLWIKVNMMKENGQFYEVMSDADLITKLQPRFAEVWGFHGHNMAYNVSVLTNTPEERWDWVKAGINLVRNEGLRYNPNDVVLHKELAFWFAHKMDGVSDDGHLHYKREHAKEWHYLLGKPPFEAEDRAAWMKEIADAPESIEEADLLVPGTQALVDELAEALDKTGTTFRLDLDQEFMLNIGKWNAVKGSPYAKILGLDATFAKNDPVYATFDRILGDPARKDQARTFVNFLRKKVLRESYNMDPEIMYEYIRDLGPIDWRHPQAHALYWAKLGSERGSKRFEDQEEMYKVMNNDRIWLQAMQALARSGLLNVDPFSGDNPGRLNDSRWIKSIDRYFREVYGKHFNSRGGGGDTFANFHENFMKQAVRELWRAGEYEDAEEIYAYLNQLYGEGGVVPNIMYKSPIDIFVKEQSVGEYEMQPEVARSDVYSALRRGFREGLLLNRPEILEEAITFAGDLTLYFQQNDTNDFISRFGEARMADLLGDLQSSVRDVFRIVMLDRALPLIDRLTIYARAGDEQKRMAYDEVREELKMEFDQSGLAGAVPFERALPEPPGMVAYRQRQAAAAAAEAARRRPTGTTAEQK
ncbi:MAG: hypothetical protein P8J59_11365 [Phycisphaerales bacterium]|jgi:hypothetical protein|nr:hypothetical protein [Phycisphaerales bacterium]